jgi:hypothetical protein
MSCPDAHNCCFVAELRLQLREREKEITKLKHSNDSAWRRIRIVEDRLRKSKRRR